MFHSKCLSFSRSFKDIQCKFIKPGSSGSWPCSHPAPTLQPQNPVWNYPRPKSLINNLHFRWVSCCNLSCISKGKWNSQMEYKWTRQPPSYQMEVFVMHFPKCLIMKQFKHADHLRYAYSYEHTHTYIPLHTPNPTRHNHYLGNIIYISWASFCAFIHTYIHTQATQMYENASQYIYVCVCKKFFILLHLKFYLYCVTLYICSLCNFCFFHT